MYWFTSDEHYDHQNIIKYCKRPFADIEEMNKEIINRHNEVIHNKDIIIHAGDTCWHKTFLLKGHLAKLNGTNIFLKGSHDKQLSTTHPYIWEKMIEDKYIVVCHYAMRTWPRSHYNSWQLFGHSHGRLDPIGKQYDVGVDNNNFYPVSFEQLKEIMENRPDNFNLIRKDNI